MKKWISLLLTSVIVINSWAQSPTYPQDSEKMEQRIREWAQKQGYELLISFKNTSAGTFFVEPAKDYTVLYVYDSNPRVATNFKASLMNPDSSLRKKYSAKPYKQVIAVIQSAETQMLQFTTKKKMDMGLTKAPVKLDAAPNANMYVYSRPKR